jgi:hypothetical protein
MSYFQTFLVHFFPTFQSLVLQMMLVGENLYTIQKNKLDAGKEVDLEVNPEKTSFVNVTLSEGRAKA